MIAVEWDLTRMYSSHRSCSPSPYGWNLLKSTFAPNHRFNLEEIQSTSREITPLYGNKSSNPIVNFLGIRVENEITKGNYFQLINSNCE
jgi:hypothetical protein